MRRLSLPMKFLIGMALFVGGAVIAVIIWILQNVRIVSNLHG